jgi:hypothetical protein
MNDDLRSLSDQLEDFSDPRTQCFLCDADLHTREATSEHVISVWAQRRFELWDQHLTLLNGTEQRTNLAKDRQSRAARLHSAQSGANLCLGFGKFRHHLLDLSRLMSISRAH